MMKIKVFNVLKTRMNTAQEQVQPLPAAILSMVFYLSLIMQAAVLFSIVWGK